MNIELFHSIYEWVFVIVTGYDTQTHMYKCQLMCGIGMRGDVKSPVWHIKCHFNQSVIAWASPL